MNTGPGRFSTRLEALVPVPGACYRCSRFFPLEQDLKKSSDVPLGHCVKQSDALHILPAVAGVRRDLPPEHDLLVSSEVPIHIG